MNDVVATPSRKIRLTLLLKGVAFGIGATVLLQAIIFVVLGTALIG